MAKTNPKLLCVYFTNDWNPIAKKGEEGYNDFVKNNGNIIHLKINSDKYPKLRWYFDAKMEPYMSLHYHGLQVVKMGGCNFEKFTKQIKRTHDYLHMQHTAPAGSENEYEQPYYNWEAYLDIKGVEQEAESTGSFISTGFKGFATISRVPDEHYIMHARMKK